MKTTLDIHRCGAPIILIFVELGLAENIFFVICKFYTPYGSGKLCHLRFYCRTRRAHIHNENKHARWFRTALADVTPQIDAALGGVLFFMHPLLISLSRKIIFDRRGGVVCGILRAIHAESSHGKGAANFSELLMT